MFEMMLMSGNNKRLVSRPVGQITYAVGGNYNFVVPKDVLSVCVVCLGAALNQGRPGYEPKDQYGPNLAGGGLIYMNNVPVAPGQIIPVQVGRPGITTSDTDYNHVTMSKFQNIAVGYAGNRRVPTGAVGFNGGRGGYDTATSILIGGSSASLTSGGTNGVATISNFYNERSKPGGWDKDMTVYTDPYPGAPVAKYGAGGIHDGYNWLSLPQGGVVRIIWGDGRSYPSRLIKDQPVKDTVWK